jgi:hypothetical protein
MTQVTALDDRFGTHTWLRVSAKAARADNQTNTT